MNELHVLAITATCGRHDLLERSVGCFVAQDYTGPHTLLIYNNSEVQQELRLPILPANKHIELINNHIDEQTGKQYDNLGAIYRDALLEVSSEVDLIYHQDDDDLFLPNHITEGVNGYLRGWGGEYNEGFKAYKPQFSWFRHPLGIDKMSNNLEPSIFIEAIYLKNHGYKLTTTDQHYGWYQPLLEEQALFVDPNGIPTLVYNWGDTNIPTFKTSGAAGNPDNFNNYRAFSRDHGDRFISPWPEGKLAPYYQEVYRERDFKIILK